MSIVRFFIVGEYVRSNSQLYCNATDVGLQQLYEDIKPKHRFTFFQLESGDDVAFRACKT